MHIKAPRPFIVLPEQRHEPCAACDSRATGVCAAIDDHDLSRLAAASVKVSFAAGQGFIAEGDPSESFFNITSGTAKLFKLLPDGRRQIIGFAGPGHFLGLASGGAFGFSAEAIGKLRACRFSRRQMSALMHDFPALERRLLEVAATELMAAHEQMLLLGRKTARERVASFLLGQSRQSSPCHQVNTQFIMPMTRADIADYLGLTIETVSRTLTLLKNEGLVALGQLGAMSLLDPVRLARIASGN